MPRYDYECSACNHAEEIFQTFKEEALEKCPACKKKKFRRVITSVNFVMKREPTTLGQLAEQKKKKLGKELVEAREAQDKAKKKPKKKNWYGTLPEDKKKVVLSSKERAEKYIHTGE